MTKRAINSGDAKSADGGPAPQVRPTLPHQHGVTAVSEAFLRRKAVEQRIGVAKSTLYAWISLGEFPRPVHLSSGAVAWIASEVDEWIHARIEQTRGQPASGTPPRSRSDARPR